MDVKYPKKLFKFLHSNIHYKTSYLAMFNNVQGDNDMVTNIHSNQNSHNSTPVKARIIRWPIVHDKVGLCRSHVHKLVSQGSFPKPIKLGLRSSGWVESEVDTWLEQRIAESRSNNPESA